ncbi:MAG: phage integrase N-terminal domain-containing protein [Gammaproteobacteria bacterium]
MGIRHNLQRSIQNILNNNRTGSYDTQANRRHILFTFAKDIISAGYGLRGVNGLKQKHIFVAVRHWQEKELSVATIKNRMSALRNLCGIINKENIVPTNDQLGIGKRSYVSLKNRAIHQPDFSKIKDPNVMVSLQLQRLFGLRREESLKIKPHMADKGDKLELLSSWCKGGRGRSVPIRTDEQRYWLDRAKQIASDFGQSLIPERKSYIRHRNAYDKQTLRAGLRNLHGLRHAYAQRRYKELTNWEAPINGGLTSFEYSRWQKEIDYRARMVLTEELGHSREQITVNYLGR